MKILRFLVFTILLAGMMASCGNPHEKALKHYKQGIRYLDQAEYKQALSSFDEAIRIYDQDPSFFFARGNVWMNKKDYRKAIEEYDKALELDKTFADAWANKGTALLYITGNKSEACPYWVKAHEHGKDNMFEKIRRCPEFVK